VTYQGQAVTNLGPSWSVAGIADFNGDGKADVFWRNTNGALVDWSMNGSQIALSQSLTYLGQPLTNADPSWSVAGVGDFNGDGRADILWRNTNGALYDWSMNGSQVASSQPLTYQGQPVTSSDPSWSIVGVGDFNGDGKADVLWRNANGALYDWSMDGSKIETSQPITYQGASVKLDPSWSVAGIGDFNGDGKADVLWRNTNGALYDWTMNGSQIETSSPFTYQGAAVNLDFLERRRGRQIQRKRDRRHTLAEHEGRARRVEYGRIGSDFDELPDLSGAGGQPCRLANAGDAYRRTVWVIEVGRLRSGRRKKKRGCRCTELPSAGKGTYLRNMRLARSRTPALEQAATRGRDWTVQSSFGRRGWYSSWRSPIPGSDDRRRSQPR
jgi:FG-GAP-like repeat